MRTFNYETFNDVYPALIAAITSEGLVATPRGTTTLEIAPVSIAVDKPWQHLVTSHGRPVNVAFAIAEIIHILMGRDDVEMLEFYNSNIKQFSDNGFTFNASYGHRLRRNFGFDQIEDVVRTLSSDPDSRQAVMGIWDPVQDRGWEHAGTIHNRHTRESHGIGEMQPRITKDRACLAGEVTLASPEGNLSVARLAAEFASGAINRWPVYSVNAADLTARLSWCDGVWEAGFKKTIRIAFDDGSSIRVTPDHPLYHKTREPKSGGSPRATYTVVREVEASSLRVGDHVLALPRQLDRGYEWFKRRITGNTAYSNRVRTHQEYAAMLNGEIPQGFDVHHIDENPSNNRADNLQLLSHGDHAAVKMLGDRNPMLHLTPEQHAARADKWRQTVSERHGWATVPNHTIVSIEEDAMVTTYDFSVPGDHNAVLGNGVVAHNCNLVSHMLIRDDRLHWLQVQRSNDAIWGTPYNWMQFSHLQAWIAGLLGVRVGKFEHVVNSMHYYLSGSYYDGAAEARGIRHFDLYSHAGEHPAWSTPSTGLLEEIAPVEQDIRNRGRTATLPTDLGYWSGALAVLKAHACYKAGEDDLAVEYLVMADPIYGPAQARFYWHTRWGVDKGLTNTKFNWNLSKQIRENWPEVVADWIMGDG